MAHRFGPRKGPPRKNRPEEAPAEDRPEQAAPGEDPLGENLLGKDLLSEGILGKDLPVLGKAKPRKSGIIPRKPLPRRGIATREMPTLGGGGGGGGEMSWLYIIGGGIILIGLVVGLVVGYVKSQVPGYVSEVNVSDPTRFDWFFVMSEAGQSTEPPALWSFFDSQRLSKYELYVPPSYSAEGAKRYPLVLFLSPSERPEGWSRWSQVCQDQEIIFVGVRDGGRGKQPWQQVRSALDVLDDVRRHYRIDPDRTYVSGLREGGVLACQLAFALPELFGGVVAIEGAGFLRDEYWLRQRVIERLSVALATGEYSDDQSQMVKIFAPYFKEIGLRSQLWVVPGGYDAMPPAAELGAIFAWLEEGLAKRQELAKLYPTSQVGGDEAPNSAEASKRLLVEAKQRLASPATLYSGVQQLRGIAHRWVGTPAAIEAGQILGQRFADRSVWEDQEVADQVLFGLPAARGLTAYLTGDLAPAHWERNNRWISTASTLWRHLRVLKPELKEEADKALTALDLVLKRPNTPR